MISKINSINNNQQVSFVGIKTTKYAMLSHESLKKAASLREACKEILGKINLNESILDNANEVFKNIKLTKKTINFSLTNLDAVRLAMPRGPEGNLFTMQVLKDKKPENTVIINKNGTLIESYCLNSERYLPQENYDKNIVDRVVSEIFDSVDFPLLQLRIKMNKTLSNAPKSYAPNGAILKKSISMQKEVQTPKTETKKPFIPPSECWEEYSMTEVIKQNADLIPPEKKVVRNKYDLLRQRKHRGASLKPIVQPSSQVVIKPIEEFAPKVDVDFKQSVTSVQPEKRRRGRPPKIRSMEQFERNTSYQIVKSKVKPSNSKKTIIQDISSGVVDSAIISKLNEIRSLYQEIRSALQQKSAGTVNKIISLYENVKRLGTKSITFGDIKIMFPHTQNFNEEIINITDLKNMQSINVSASGKMFAGEGEWSSIVMRKNKLRLISQDEIDKRIAEGGVDKKLDLAIIELKAFKNYIDKEGWRVKKSREFNDSIASKINKNINKRLQVAKEIYDEIQEIYNSMSQRKRVDIKKNYSNLNTVKKSSRLEFITPEKDGTTILFDYSDNKLGSFYKLAKLSPENQLEELFLVSIDGQVLKNAIKDKGVAKVFPTNSVFYTMEEFKENNISERVDDLLLLLEQNMTNYRDYLIEEKSKILIDGMMGRKIHKKVESKENIASVALSQEPVITEIKSKFVEAGNINLVTVKEFFEKTVNELQISADKLRELTGFKSMLDSVVESLKSKFDDFISQYKK